MELIQLRTWCTKYYVNTASGVDYPDWSSVAIIFSYILRGVVQFFDERNSLYRYKNILQYVIYYITYCRIFKCYIYNIPYLKATIHQSFFTIKLLEIVEFWKLIRNLKLSTILLTVTFLIRIVILYSNIW